MFYHIWIPHYAHVVELLYRLLKKGRKFEWREDHMKSVQKIKGLVAAPELRKVVYSKDIPAYVTVDTSPIGTPMHGLNLILLLESIISKEIYY